MSERNISFLLKDIIDFIQNIVDFIKGMSFDTYSCDIRTRHAVEHNFMIIGKAVSRIPTDIKRQIKI